MHDMTGVVMNGFAVFSPETNILIMRFFKLEFFKGKQFYFRVYT